jgi:hypothetical protein
MPLPRCPTQPIRALEQQTPSLLSELGCFHEDPSSRSPHSEMF